MTALIDKLIDSTYYMRRCVQKGISKLLTGKLCMYVCVCVCIYTYICVCVYIKLHIYQTSLLCCHAFVDQHTEEKGS